MEVTEKNLENVEIFNNLNIDIPEDKPKKEKKQRKSRKKKEEPQIGLTTRQLIEIPLLLINKKLLEYEIPAISDDEKDALAQALDETLKYYEFEPTPPVMLAIVVAQISIPRFFMYLQKRKEKKEKDV